MRVPGIIAAAMLALASTPAFAQQGAFALVEGAFINELEDGMTPDGTLEALTYFSRTGDYYFAFETPLRGRWTADGPRLCLQPEDGAQQCASWGIIDLDGSDRGAAVQLLNHEGRAAFPTPMTGGTGLFRAEGDEVQLFVAHEDGTFMAGQLVNIGTWHAEGLSLCFVHEDDEENICETVSQIDDEGNFYLNPGSPYANLSRRID